MSDSDGPSEPKKPINTTNLCHVCGDIATIINYGALSCLSCRTFFRRNAFPNKELPMCRYDGLCEVNKLTRRICTACRLAKCLSVGMSPELIRKEDLGAIRRKSRKSIANDSTVMITTQRSTLNVPDTDDRTQLTPSDQTLISNIVHAYDAFSPISEVQHMIETVTKSASNQEFDLSQSLHVMSLFYNALQSFISSIPDFKVLTPTEQRSLFQRNLHGILCIGGMFLMRESGIFDKEENEQILLPLYGNESLQEAKLIVQHLNSDPVLFKLMLIALAFSSNCYAIHNRGNFDKDSLLLGTFRLLGSQNVYVELMWKYLIYTYNATIAVKQFSTLVKQLLDIVKFSINLYDINQTHQKFIDDTILQYETSSNINEKAVIPLWGKK